VRRAADAIDGDHDCIRIFILPQPQQQQQQQRGESDKQLRITRPS